MNKTQRVVLHACLAIWLAASFSLPVIASPRQQLLQDRSTAIVFFDVSDLPARIDEPKLRESDEGVVLGCAMP